MMESKQQGSTCKPTGADADLIIVGGGSAGFAAAIRGHKLDARVIMVNAGVIGGTCVNVGCIPSKTLIRAAEAHYRAILSRFAGIETTARVSDFGAVIGQKDALVAQLRQAKYVEVLRAYDRVKLIEGQARLESPSSVRVNGELYEGTSIKVATGARPWLPDIPGLAGSGPLDSTSAFELKCLPESMIVLGGRYIALEIAQMFARFGTRVTVLQRSERILPTEDPDLTDALTGYLRGEGLRIETSVRLRDVTRNGAKVVVRARVGDEDEDENKIFEAEQILCATGRRANTENLGLEEIGVRLSENGDILVDDTLQTSRPGVFAAGDVIGEPAFVYTAAYEGRLAAANALNTLPPDIRKRDYRVLPWVIFSDPQVAGVGLNELEAAGAGLEVDVATLDLSNVPRALVARDTRGFVKLIRRRGSDELVGARILAPEGGEQIMEAALAIRHGIGVSELAAAFHPYLTQAEGIKLCAQTFGKDVTKLSCCSA
jgi:mercuric reductase